MEQKPTILQVSRLFTNVKYEIPIYQRNYAWGEKQIHQLIDDISGCDDVYFLGNLIVNQKEAEVYEVIDGQQRLTTLYLLERYLKMEVLKGALYFEAREKSNRTLEFIGTEKADTVLYELQSEELNNGYKIIQSYFLSEGLDTIAFQERLSNVQLIRIQVPPNIDLNHYFEIMNTRGEQLEYHEIVKAKVLSKLSTQEDKKAGALIWEACTNMDSYVQMNFKFKQRKELFTGDWSNLQPDVRDFNTVKTRLDIGTEEHPTQDTKTLLEILLDTRPIKADQTDLLEENERFESIISFPHFLLQVNKAMTAGDEQESLLDDKYFLAHLAPNWQDEKAAKYFLYYLLKCRVLFDQYILKREFARDYKEIGKWSLQRLEAYHDTKSKSLKPKYVGTYVGDTNKQLRTLQACLRITYTSPKSMHWIALALRELLDNQSCNLIKCLERYCKDKLDESQYKDAFGFGVERIVFTYLDYLLYRDGYTYQSEEWIKPLSDEWQIQFRNSIEHFFPQHPLETEKWESEDLDGFGNLALITISGNSKFSNLPPQGKVASYPSLIEQSLKLKVMKEMMDCNGGVWSKDISKKHKDAMYAILQQ